jgi:hypothetical protein
MLIFRRLSMRKYSMKLSVLILSVLIFLLITSGCPTEPPLTSAIFSDVIEIVISPYSGTIDPAIDSFTYTLPPEVKYAIVELFPSGTTFPDNKTVPIDDLIAGNRTDLAGFTRDAVKADELYPKNAEGTDFDTTGYYNVAGPTNIDYVWIVLGYDENMILTHASAAGEITVNWP